jgi:two-component system chemotaxis response regulator CheY
MESGHVLLGTGLVSFAVGLGLKAICWWLRLPDWRWQGRRERGTAGIILSMKPMKKSVLVVDDDAAVRQSVTKVLEGAGYEVAAASDGEAAVVQFVPEQIDLVLLDLNLPLRDGWDVFERLTTRYPFVPVIIITGMPNQYRTALAAGASALMEKPIDVPALLKTMDELLAEPKEARLRRLCGYQQDTKHLRAPNADAAGNAHPVKSHERSRPHGVPRWNAT